MKRLPPAYLVAVSSLIALAVLVALVVLGVPPFDNFAVFIVSQVAGALTLLVFGVIGGAFVGMVLAHRILANRDFTPYERTVLERLEEIRTRLDEMEKRFESERARR